MRKREPLEPEDSDRLLKAAAGMGLDIDFTVRALRYTGMRADELAHMDSDWIVWLDEQIRVPIHKPCGCAECRSKAEQSKDRTIDDYWRPKTDKGARTIPVRDPETWRVMREFFKRHQSVGVTRKTLWRRVKLAAEEAELRVKVMPHTLRHTYGTSIAARGATPQYIRQTMGHETFEAARDYIQYSGRQLGDEADKLFGGGRGGAESGAF